MDLNKLRELAGKTKSSMKRFEKVSRPTKDKNRYRILPGWREGEEHVFHRAFGAHYIKDETDTLLEVYPCAAHIDDADCPICNEIQRAARVADPATVELLGKAKASKVYLVNAIDLDGDVNTPVILELKSTVFKTLLEIIEDAAEAGEDPVFDLANGKEFVINREGKGLTTKYSAVLSAKRAPVSPAVLDKLHNLDEYVQQESEPKRLKALSAVRTVAGALPAPRDVTPGSRDVPVTRRADPDLDRGDEDLRTLEGSARTVAPAAIDDDLESLLGSMETGTHG